MIPQLEAFLARMRRVAGILKALPESLDVEPRGDNVRLPARLEAFDHQLSGLEEEAVELERAARTVKPLRGEVAPPRAAGADE